MYSSGGAQVAVLIKKNPAMHQEDTHYVLRRLSRFSLYPSLDIKSAIGVEAITLNKTLKKNVGAWVLYSGLKKYEIHSVFLVYKNVSSCCIVGFHQNLGSTMFNWLL